VGGIFDIPVSVDVSSLRLRFRGGMTGDSEELPLTVQADRPEPVQTQIEAPARVDEATPAPVSTLDSSSTSPIPSEKQPEQQPTTSPQPGTTPAPTKTPARKSAINLLPTLLSSTHIGRHGTSCFDKSRHRWWLPASSSLTCVLLSSAWAARSICLQPRSQRSSRSFARAGCGYQLPSPKYRAISAEEVEAMPEL
jgi:hypothetical protein